MCFRARTQRTGNKEANGNRKANDVGSHPPKGPSPIKIDVLEAWLQNYPIQADVAYLLDGVAFTLC